MGAAAPERGRPPATGLVLGDYIRPDLLAPKLAGTTPVEVIDELLSLLQSAGKLTDPAAARHAVLHREQQMHTGLADGLAIPHARTDGVGELVCAIGLSGGVDFGAPDGTPARVVVLTLAPPGGTAPYLQFLAAVLQVFEGTDHDSILAARTPAELYAAITGRGAPNQA